MYIKFSLKYYLNTKFNYIHQTKLFLNKKLYENNEIHHHYSAFKGANKKNQIKNDFTRMF